MFRISQQNTFANSFFYPSKSTQMHQILTLLYPTWTITDSSLSELKKKKVRLYAKAQECICRLGFSEVCMHAQSCPALRPFGL